MDRLNSWTKERWPRSAGELIALQQHIANIEAGQWRPSESRAIVGATFVCFGHSPRDGAERAWACAVAARGRRVLSSEIVSATIHAPYQPGLLALREGSLLEHAVSALSETADVVLVNASGRDHPQRAGLAVHLGWALGIPTIGVTDRPLVASAAEPGRRRGDSTPLTLAGAVVGYRVRTRTETRPVVAHAAWRTAPETARDVVLNSVRRARTPEPMRRARRLARLARANAGAAADASF